MSKMAVVGIIGPIGEIVPAGKATIHSFRALAAAAAPRVIPRVGVARRLYSIV
jgi:hypothetical protein